jgi:putative FmdB family regulatory protein
MPIYAFACSACRHHFDRLQKLSDPDPSACPVCGAEAVKRQVTAPSFRLSGSGWYETDFKKDSDKKRNLSEARGTGSEAKAGTTTPSKPADAGTKAEKAAATPTKAAPAAAAKPASGTS